MKLLMYVPIISIMIFLYCSQYNNYDNGECHEHNTGPSCTSTIVTRVPTPAPTYYEDTCTYIYSIHNTSNYGILLYTSSTEYIKINAGDGIANLKSVYDKVLIDYICSNNSERISYTYSLSCSRNSTIYLECSNETKEENQEAKR